MRLLLISKKKALTKVTNVKFVVAFRADTHSPLLDSHYATPIEINALARLASQNKKNKKGQTNHFKKRPNFMAIGLRQYILYTPAKRISRNIFLPMNVWQTLF